jgi:hypothetical protein
MKMLSKIFLLVAATTVFIISIGQGLEPCCAHPSICLPIVCKNPPCCIPNGSLDQPIPSAGDSLDHDSEMDKPQTIIIIICMAIFMCILLILFMIYLPCSRPRIPL